jgi:hypothetical protein
LLDPKSISGLQTLFIVWVEIMEWMMKGSVYTFKPFDRFINYENKRIIKTLME